MLVKKQSHPIFKVIKNDIPNKIMTNDNISNADSNNETFYSQNFSPIKSNECSLNSYFNDKQFHLDLPKTRTKYKMYDKDIKQECIDRVKIEII